jgi:hypothetical protein
MNAGPQQWPKQTEATVVDQNDVASTLPSPSAGFRPVPRRFAHFELEIDPYGKQVELGRGAMGVTYKGEREISGGLGLRLMRPVTVMLAGLSLHPPSRELPYERRPPGISRSRPKGATKGTLRWGAIKCRFQLIRRLSRFWPRVFSIESRLESCFSAKS